jgi:hypothetical protein
MGESPDYPSPLYSVCCDLIKDGLHGYRQLRLSSLTSKDSRYIIETCAAKYTDVSTQVRVG